MVVRSTGEVRDTMVLVGVLGRCESLEPGGHQRASNYTLVDVTWSRALPDWTMSHVRVFGVLGRGAELVIPDNKKAGGPPGQYTWI